MVLVQELHVPDAVMSQPLLRIDQLAPNVALPLVRSQSLPQTWAYEVTPAVQQRLGVERSTITPPAPQLFIR